MSDLATSSPSAPAAQGGSTRSETMSATDAAQFPEFIAPPASPLGLLEAWLHDSVERGIREPRALALATADEQGRTSSRIVALNSLTDTGIVFITHSDSRKGRELAANPWASGVLYWRETCQQINLAGPTRRLPDSDAEALWFARPTFTHAMTTASRQSSPLRDLEQFAQLRARALELAEPLQPLPRPATFVAFHMELTGVEFWANGTDRLHERLRYDRTGDTWQISRLQP